ncbi:MAG TPA: hypothetical protein VEM39_01510 [Myxococcaceae bacterium]|nr:hypothetical protein [Myxococcaceae bacterium]
MKLLKPLLITALVVPILALAASQLDSPQRAVPPGRLKQLARMRMMRIAGLADALGLDDGTALHLNDVMRQFDDRRVALEVENGELAKTIKRASDGDPAALGGTDQALQRIWDNRTEIQQLNRAMFEAVGRELTPQQRAKMLIFMATFQAEQQEMNQRAQERNRQEALKTAVERAAGNAPK